MRAIAQVQAARLHVPDGHVLLQLVPGVAPHVQVWKPDRTVGEGSSQALNAGLLEGAVKAGHNGNRRFELTPDRS